PEEKSPADVLIYYTFPRYNKYCILSLTVTRRSNQSERIRSKLNEHETKTFTTFWSRCMKYVGTCRPILRLLVRRDRGRRVRRSCDRDGIFAISSRTHHSVARDRRGGRYE